MTALTAASGMPFTDMLTSMYSPVAVYSRMQHRPCTVDIPVRMPRFLKSDFCLVETKVIAL